MTFKARPCPKLVVSESRDVNCPAGVGSASQSGPAWSCMVLDVVQFFVCFKHANISNIIIIELNQIMPNDANEKSEAIGSTRLAQEKRWLAFALGRQLALPRQLARQHQR